MLETEVESLVWTFQCTDFQTADFEREKKMSFVYVQVLFQCCDRIQSMHPDSTFENKPDPTL